MTDEMRAKIREAYQSVERTPIVMFRAADPLAFHFATEDAIAIAERLVEEAQELAYLEVLHRLDDLSTRAEAAEALLDAVRAALTKYGAYDANDPEDVAGLAAIVERQAEIAEECDAKRTELWQCLNRKKAAEAEVARLQELAEYANKLCDRRNEKIRELEAALRPFAFEADELTDSEWSPPLEDWHAFELERNTSFKIRDGKPIGYYGGVGLRLEHFKSAKQALEKGK